jgi:hypothetical protein
VGEESDYYHTVNHEWGRVVSYKNKSLTISQHGLYPTVHSGGDEGARVLLALLGLRWLGFPMCALGAMRGLGSM